jgi:hypothetical protein
LLVAPTMDCFAAARNDDGGCGFVAMGIAALHPACGLRDQFSPGELPFRRASDGLRDDPHEWLSRLREM